MTANPLADHAARVSTLPEDILLGFLVWFTVPTDTRVDYRDFERLAKVHGLDDRPLPIKPHASDVYRRSVTANEVRSVVRPDGGRETFLLRKHESKHQVVRETYSPRGKRLAYKVLANLNYDPPTEAILLEELESGDVFIGEAHNVARDVRSYFSYWRAALTHYTVRGFVREKLYQWNAVCVRPSGGVYFLFPGHKTDMANLQAFLQDIGSLGQIPRLDIIPLVDDRNQRAMLRAAYEDETVGELERMIADIKTILSEPDKKISKEKGYTFMEGFQGLAGKNSEYLDLLGGQMVHAESALEVVQSLLPEILDRVKD